MSTVKQVRLAALLTLALVAGTAQAQSQVSGQTRLQPDWGDEFDASGTARFRGSVWLGGGWWLPPNEYQAWFDGTLTVSCQGLTPFATYVINGSAYFTADSHGRATLTLSPFTAVGLGSGKAGHLGASFQVTVARQVTADTYVNNVLLGSIQVKLY